MSAAQVKELTTYEMLYKRKEKLERKKERVEEELRECLVAIAAIDSMRIDALRNAPVAR